MNNDQILKSPCCNKQVRAEVSQSVDVFINRDSGFLDNGSSFSDPSVNRDFLWCEECNKELDLEWSEDTHTYSLVVLE